MDPGLFIVREEVFNENMRILFHFFIFLLKINIKNLIQKMTKSLQDFFLGCKECVLENPRSFYGSFSLGPF
jgi:hypothetical protein